MDKASALGEYLRARRDLVRPEDIGLIPSSRRKVPGLRREELAMLAGISPDYYLRLEQGRDQHPSDQVLDALASALQLDAAATAHLRDLGRPRSRRRSRPRAERVPAGIAQLLGDPGACLRHRPVPGRAGRQPAGPRAVTEPRTRPQRAAPALPGPRRPRTAPGLGPGHG